MLTKLSNSKFLIPAMAFLVVLATGAGFYISLKQSQNRQERSEVSQGLFWPNPKQINGKWSFIFFGYTNCPDICPITMSVMVDVYRNLTTEFDDIQTIFVTVDPERDTKEKLSSYVNFFDKNFIGLNGEPENKNSLVRQIGIAYFSNKEKDNYLVDHSASIFVIDPKMRLIAKLSPPHQLEKIIDQFKNIKRFVDEKG